MLKAISTQVHVRERLHPGILERMAGGGVAGIEIFAKRGHFDYDSAQHIREIASWFGSQAAVRLQSMHSPLQASGELGRSDTRKLNIAGRERKERIEAMHKFEGALTSVEHLRAFAKPLGVQLLLENTPNELSAPEKLVELIRTLHYDDIGVCLDLGHAHLGPGVEAAIEMLNPLIRSVHVHDNHGLKDEHLWPGEGSIDFHRAMELLRTAPQVPALVLEIEGDPEGNPEYGKTVPGKMLASWELLENGH